MPVWHEAAREAVKAGKLVLLGVTHEQHADRCRLFAQWKQFDWPILHDPINVIPTTVVPMVIAIDEHGIVRHTRLRPDRLAEDFLSRSFADDAPPAAAPFVVKQDLAILERRARTENTADAWRAFGDALVLWGGPSRINDAIAAYRTAREKEPEQPGTLFRLGVCYRMRYELPSRVAGDFQRAVDDWQEALAQAPNQYIWRRRIQQYGPRLDKPYPFYDWVDEAVAEIERRGEKPIQLAVQPYGAELARPSRAFERASKEIREPDPRGLIDRDKKRLIRCDVATVPATTGADSHFRVHLTFAPNGELQAHWNNEAEPLQVWVNLPNGVSASTQLLTAPQPLQPESTETRRVDFEVQIDSGSRDGKVTLKAYALYYVCEGIDGTCLFLRQDIPITLSLAKSSSDN